MKKLNNTYRLLRTLVVMFVLGACRTLGANEEEKGLNFEIFRIWLQQKLVLIFALLTQFQM